MNRLKKLLIIIALIAMGTGTLFAFRSVTIESFSGTIEFNMLMPREPIPLEANYILSCQVKDDRYGSDDKGCINDVVPGNGPTWVVPRENGTAILGLIEAYRATSKIEYKNGALLCADYLKNRQEADYSWCDRYEEQAVDPSLDGRTSRNKSPSMAGSAIMAFYKIRMMGWEDADHRYYDNAKNAAEYIMACVDNKPGTANGLVGGGKEYGDSYPNTDYLGKYRWSDWSWTSDNCYAYISLSCMKEWAKAKEDIEFSGKCERYAAGILNGINTCLKNPNNAVWYRVVGGNGEPVADSTKIDALCYYPQKYDLPVPKYGCSEIAQWMMDNLQVKTGTVTEGCGAYLFGDVDPVTTGRLSMGYSLEAYLALLDIQGDTARNSREMAKTWWEYKDNTNGRGKLWDLVNGGIIDWYDPDGVPDGYLAQSWEKFIDTSANCIFAYRGGYNYNLVTEPVSADTSFNIAHIGIDRISPVTRVVVATGTVTDTISLDALKIFYRRDTDPGVDFTTATFNVAGKYTCDFKQEMSLANTEAKSLSYYIKAVNSRGDIVYWPGAGKVQQATVEPATVSEVTQAGGRVVLSDGNGDDGETSLTIPEGALSSNTSILISELNPAESSVPQTGYGLADGSLVALYSFSPEGLVFNKPAKLSLLYQDMNHDGIVDGTAYRAEDLKVVWWDGYSWVVIGGTVDLAKNIVTADIMHFSLYGLAPMAALKDNDYRPKERIITPALVDGKNDFATFGGLNAGDTVNIFDVKGKKVRQLSDGLFIWNGKDDNDMLVESGLYIYQIKAGGKVISGTIVVAK